MHHLPPMIAEFLLTPFLIAWPCPGLYGKSALAVEKEITSEVEVSSIPLIPNHLILISSCNSSTLPVFPNDIHMLDGPILVLFPQEAVACAPAPGLSLAQGPESTTPPLEEYWRTLQPRGSPLQFRSLPDSLPYEGTSSYDWLKSAPCPLLSHSQLVALDVSADDLSIALQHSFKKYRFFKLVSYLVLKRHGTLKEFVKG